MGQGSAGAEMTEEQREERIESNMNTKQRGRLKQKNFREQMLDHLYWPHLLLIQQFCKHQSQETRKMLTVLTQTPHYIGYRMGLGNSLLEGILRVQ